MKKERKKRLDATRQKNALQRICAKFFEPAISEVKFDWAITPDRENLPEEYKNIVKALTLHRNFDVTKRKQTLLCDFVLEERKIIIEYDEEQHFTLPRKISLENYPNNIKLSFPKEKWIEACRTYNRQDNNPPNRDEGRAYYDAIRDIEAYKNGYKLIRILHGEIDWEQEGAEKELENLINSEYKYQTNMKNYKIARIVLDELGFQDNWTYLLRKFFEKNYQKAHFEFLTLAGGFYEKSFPNKLLKYSVEEIENDHIEDIIKGYAKEIEADFQQFEKVLKIPFSEVVDYITLGVDGKVFDGFGNSLDDKHIELVAIYDTNQKKIVHWTGKFYPLENQKKNLVKINDLDSHFITLNHQKIMVLGCHDLSVYNPRGQANSKPNSWKSEKSEEFRKRAREFAPSIVLQHPHTTDSPNIWQTSWNGLEKDLPSVEHYVSGILYFNPNEIVRADLDKVLEGTQKGDVINFSRENLA